MIRTLGKLLIVPALTLFFVGCDKADTPAAGAPGGNGAGQQKSQEPVPVTFAETVLQPMVRTVEVTGTLYGDEESTISAKVSGRIVRIFKDVGDRAADHEPLAQIDRTDYELAVNQARMAVLQTLAKLGVQEMPGDNFDPSKVPTVQQKRLEAANAEARYRRAEQLFNQKPPLISEQDYADQKTAYQVAQAAYEVELLNARALVAEAKAKQSDLKLAEQRLADTTVRAPIEGDGKLDAVGHVTLRSATIQDGSTLLLPMSNTSDSTTSPSTLPTTQPEAQRFAVAARNVSVGEYVSEGTAMFRLVADNPIKFRGSVPERYIGQIQVGQDVQVRIESSTEPFTGKVTRINPQVDPASRSFGIEVLVPNPRGTLRPGAFARASVGTKLDPQVAFIPEKAVSSFAGVNKAFTVKDGKAVEHRLSLGVRRDGLIEVIDGLEGVQRVVASGVGRLADGTPVTEEAGSSAK